LDEIIERYEYKYLIPNRFYPAVRDAALAVCRIDKYAGPDGTYRIRSLYLDTEHYDLYWANQREQGDRFKARIRIYPGKPSPVFFEIKRRVFDVIVKSRAAVPMNVWREALHGQEAALATLSPSARKGLMKFQGPFYRHHLAPKMLIEYEREAYISDIDSYARLTFDRKIMVQPQEKLDFEADPKGFRVVDHVAQTRTQEPMTVLELKFERRPPAWMSALVRRLELVRLSFSKYCYGVNAELSLPQQRFVKGS